MGRDLLRLLVILAAAPAASCADQAMPGTIWGDYAVVGTSTANTCGAGQGAPDPWKFTVELSKDGSKLYWNWLDSNPAVAGVLVSNSTTISASQQSNVDSSEAGAGACTMERDDTLTVTVGSGTTPTTFTGTMTYSFAATSGSSCADQLTTSGGTYAALPCSMAYTLSATKQ
jgi:hypothetical protein